MNRRATLVALAACALGAGLAIQCGNFSGNSSTSGATDGGADGTAAIEGGNADGNKPDGSAKDATVSEASMDDDGGDDAGIDSGPACTPTTADCTNSLCDKAGTVLTPCLCPTHTGSHPVYQFPNFCYSMFSDGGTVCSGTPTTIAYYLVTDTDFTNIGATTAANADGIEVYYCHKGTDGFVWQQQSGGSCFNDTGYLPAYLGSATLGVSCGTSLVYNSPDQNEYAGFDSADIDGGGTPIFGAWNAP